MRECSEGYIVTDAQVLSAGLLAPLTILTLRQPIEKRTEAAAEIHLLPTTYRLLPTTHYSLLTTC